VCALERNEFTGAAALRAQREQGGFDRLVAFRVEGRGIPRQGMAIRPSGEVTSGTMSPSLEVGIGMGYVPAGLAAEGTEIEIDVRGRPVAARVASKPLYAKEKVT
jgi:aminomethyltransferase